MNLNQKIVKDILQFEWPVTGESGLVWFLNVFDWFSIWMVLFMKLQPESWSESQELECYYRDLDDGQDKIGRLERELLLQFLTGSNK